MSMLYVYVHTVTPFVESNLSNIYKIVLTKASPFLFPGEIH